MKLLIDSDAFCKLGTGGLLLEGLSLLGTDLASCGRLPALPYMLRRGTLPRRFGVAACENLIPIAEAIPRLPIPDNEWLGPLTDVSEIDFGEAQIFAAAAQFGLSILTGDKRALMALKGLPNFTGALAYRVVALESLLLVLCARLGNESVRNQMRPVISQDKSLMICFSSSNPNPRAGLRSYAKALAADVYPLLLWEPPMG